MSTSSSCAKPEFKKGDKIAGFEIVKKLGSGGYGAVYHVQKDGIQAALKTEFVVEKQEETLLNEAHILRIMQGSELFCRIISAKRVKFQNQEANILVMTLCRKALSRFRRMMPDHKFSKSTAARLSFQILVALRDLHGMGILHRDVKGSNCGWYEPNRRVLLFDLGLCRRFLENDDKTNFLNHRRPRKTPGFMGTSKYCSLNVHEELDQGRRDDLWAWLYTTVEFFTGPLPWSSETTRLISYRKKRYGRHLFMKCPREIVTIYAYVNQLKFDSCPDYPFIFEQFSVLFKRLDIEESDPYDFEQGSEYYDKYFNKQETESEVEMNTSSLGSDSDTEGSETKAEKVVDVDNAPKLPDNGEVITLNSTRSKSSCSTENQNIGNRLAAGINRAYKKFFSFH